MNTGQMMMTIGALLLLSTTMLSVNSNNMMNESFRDEAQFGLLATSIATSLIEEAKSKAFDEKTDTIAVSNVNQLTSLLGLGPDAGETYETFDDFDDFDKYTTVDSTMPSAVFNILCEVDYVTTSNLQGSSPIATWHKKLTVTVASPFMADTIRASSIYSYWFFR